MIPLLYRLNSWCWRHDFSISLLVCGFILFQIGGVFYILYVLYPIVSLIRGAFVLSALCFLLGLVYRALLDALGRIFRK